MTPSSTSANAFRIHDCIGHHLTSSQTMLWYIVDDCHILNAEQSQLREHNAH